MRPIFETPRLDGLAATPGEDAGFFGSVAAGWEAQRAFDNFNAESYLLDRLWSEYLGEIEHRTGTRLEHPGSAGMRAARFINRSRFAEDEDAGGDRETDYAFIQRQIADLQAANPDIDIPGEEWLRDRLRAEAVEIEGAEGRAGLVGGFVGRLGGAFTDPINLITAPIGGAQKTVARAAGVEALVNMVLEAGNIPIANEWRAELGVDTMDLGEAAVSVGVAGVFGAALGGGARGLQDLPGLAARTPGLRNQQSVRALAVASEMRAQLRTGAARLPNRLLVQALYDLGPEDREILQIAAALEREAEIEARNPFTPADADLHEARLQDALTAVTERGTERAAAAAARLAEDAPPPAAAAAEDARPGGIVALDPRELEVDAARFQFKGGGDAEGVTDRLAGVTEWDPVRAGIAIVFEQEDGRRFIADGHQRRGLAARLLNQNPDRDIALNAFIYREADGWTDAEIRALAAAKNLAEGTGTAIDAAKILRADPALLDGSLPTRGAMIRDAQGLMDLSDTAFGAIVNEVVPANYGAIVGRLVSDPDEQLAVIEQLARAEVRSAVEAEALVRGAQAAGFARREGETGSLFGETPTESLVADRARVLARAISILRKEKTVFSTLAREADRIESAGNQLARDTNQERARTDAQTLEVLQALAHRAGPVADALNARTRQADGNFAGAARAFVGDLRDLTASGDLGRLLAGRSGRDAETADASGGPSGAPLEAGPRLDLEPGRFEGGADDPAMAAQADNLAPDDGAGAADPDPAGEAGLRALLDEGADAQTIAAHPIVKAALDDAASRPATVSLYDVESESYRAERRFITPDGELVGVEAGLDWHVDNAKRLAWADDGLDLPAEPIRYERELTFVIGYPAAGKSSVANPVARHRGAAILDADEIKKTLPEYDGGAGAQATHRESSDLSMTLFEALSAEGANIVWPKVGGDPAKIERLASQARARGYEVNIVWMDTPQPEAMRRMVSRGLSSGRFIPPQNLATERVAFQATYDYMRDAGRTRHAVLIDGSPPREIGPQIVTDEGGFLDGSQIQDAASGNVARDVSSRGGRVRGADAPPDGRRTGDDQARGRPAEGEAPDAALLDEFDAELIFDPGEGPGRSRVSAADVEAEIAADDAAVERLRGCVP